MPGPGSPSRAGGRPGWTAAGCIPIGGAAPASIGRPGPCRWQAPAPEPEVWKATHTIPDGGSVGLVGAQGRSSADPPGEERDRGPGGLDSRSLVPHSHRSGLGGLGGRPTPRRSRVDDPPKVECRVGPNALAEAGCFRVG